MKLSLKKHAIHPRIFTIFLPGEPTPYEFIPKSSSAKRFQSYNPQTHHLEINKEHIQEQVPKPLNCNLIIAFTFFLPPPIYLTPRHFRRLAEIPHITPPSLQDLVRFYLSVCDDTLFSQKSSLSAYTARKVYCAPKQEPHTEILITCL